MKNSFRTLVILIMVIYLSPIGLFSQSKDQIKTNNYKAWVTSMHKYVMPCYLYSIEDSLMGFYTIEKNKTMNFKIKDISTVKFRKEGNITKWCLYGALTGFIAGTIIGFTGEGGLAGRDFHTAFKDGMTIYVPYFTLYSAVIGGLIASVKIEIPIYGSQDNYNAQKAKLEKYKYK